MQSRRKSLLTVLLGATLVLAFGGCSEDSPTAPATGPGVTPGSDGTSGGDGRVWSISVVVDPEEVEFGSGDQVLVSVDVRRQDDGSRPANGTVVTVSTSAGTIAGASAVLVELQRGKAQLLLNPAGVTGGATIVVAASLENDSGSARVSILEPPVEPDPVFFRLTGVSPPEGTFGDTVTLEGLNIEEPVTVEFAGVPARVISVTATKIRVEVPKPVTEVPINGFLAVEVAAEVRVGELTAESDSLANAFRYIGPFEPEPADFFISHVDPNQGDPNGGDIVSIVGGGFAQPATVTIGGAVATVVGVSSRSISVETPPSLTAVGPNDVLPVAVSVTVNAGSADARSATLSNGFYYTFGGLLQPEILAVTPASGPNEGGTTVRIVGRGFQSPAQVFFGFGDEDSFDGIEAVVTSVSDDEIVVTSPRASGFGQDLRNQQVDILYVGIDTGFRAAAPGAFTYGTSLIITSMSPVEGDATGGTRVTIFGQGFDEPVIVEFGGQQQNVLSVTGTELLVTTPGLDRELSGADPCRASIFPMNGVFVVNLETDESVTNGALSFGYVFPDRNPKITGVSPVSGTGAGGTSVTISGLNFQSPVRVEFGSGVSPATSVGGGGTSITATTPPFADLWDTEECDDDGDGTVGSRLVPTTVDVSVLNLITGCTTDADTGFTFTYLPTDTSCQGDAGPVEPPAPQCNDGIDNDGDTFIDFPDDPECTSLADITEDV